MLLVGLTGGLGAGKSTVASMLAARGAVVVDADDLARRAIEPGTPGHAKVLETFGDEVEASDGSIDRRALAAIVFADENRRRALESITHPEVFRLLAEEVERRRGSDAVVVFDAPLIVETGFAEACDLLVVVSAAAADQIARVRELGFGEEEARARIEAQVSPEEREARADVVLRNDGDLDSLERKVDTLWSGLESEARARD
jgi:dephospho-CoA kinase